MAAFQRCDVSSRRHLSPPPPFPPAFPMFSVAAPRPSAGGGISQMHIPPSVPTLTMIRRSGEMRTADIFPLCPEPMLVVKPSS